MNVQSFFHKFRHKFPVRIMKFPSQIDRRLVLKAGLMLATPMQTFSVLQNT
jgi:hypothetical protein